MRVSTLCLIFMILFVAIASSKMFVAPKLKKSKAVHRLAKTETKDPHEVAMTNNFFHGVPPPEDEHLPWVAPKKCHDAAAPQVTRFAQLRRKAKRLQRKLVKNLKSELKK